MTSIRWLFFLLTLALGAAPVRAGPYPPGSRIGLTPPSGMVTSKSFFGYEDPEHNAAIILVALPVQAYSALDKSITATARQKHFAWADIPSALVQQWEAARQRAD